MEKFVNGQYKMRTPPVMSAYDQMDFSTINPSYDYDYYWPKCKVQNLTLDAADIVKILGLPSFQFAFTISKVLIIACFCMTFIIGIMGNGLVIWIAGFKMKTVSAVWFVNLAIVDFMFCISLPFRVTMWFLSYDDRTSLQAFNFALLHINSFISVLFLTAISIDRCVAIIWPFWSKVHRTRKLVNICSVFIWTVPLSIVIPGMLIYDTDIHIFYLLVPMYDDLSYYCQIKYSSAGKYLMFSRCFIMFGLSFSIILVCYSLIIFRLRSNTIKRPRKFQRTFRIIIAVVVCFFGCWFPYNVWPLIAKNETVYQVLTDFMISSLCLCLVSINSCLNPVLYVLLGKGEGSNWRKIKSRLECSMNELK
ncbi:chemerin-like receptor 1 [Aquarana catesbeiana]|uniref:chemerin-like receptor 1 n=1 Tax=Aquarana catesbeiana TaxID=8400 RepID=UPI003CC93BFC